MVVASRGFITVLVKVPEAYTLVRLRQASRPGFLFLNADKQRLADVCMAKMNSLGLQTFDPPDVPTVVGGILEASKAARGHPVGTDPALAPR